MAFGIPSSLPRPERPRSRLWGAEDGLALVEFVLVSPVVLLLLFAIVDFGRALNYRQETTQLAGTGARLAAVNNCPGTLGTNCLQQYLRSLAGAGELRDGSSSVSTPLRICIEFPNGATEHTPVKVTASFGFTWIPFLNLATSNVSSSATMRLERTPEATKVNAGCVPT